MNTLRRPGKEEKSLVQSPIYNAKPKKSCFLIFDEPFCTMRGPSHNSNPLFFRCCLIHFHLLVLDPQRRTCVEVLDFPMKTCGQVHTCRPLNKKKLYRLQTMVWNVGFC